MISLQFTSRTSYEWSFVISYLKTNKAGSEREQLQRIQLEAFWLQTSIALTSALRKSSNISQTKDQTPFLIRQRLGESCCQFHSKSGHTKADTQAVPCKRLCARVCQCIDSSRWVAGQRSASVFTLASVSCLQPPKSNFCSRVNSALPVPPHPHP